MLVIIMEINYMDVEIFVNDGLHTDQQIFLRLYSCLTFDT